MYIGSNFLQSLRLAARPMETRSEGKVHQPARSRRRGFERPAVHVALTLSCGSDRIVANSSRRDLVPITSESPVNRSEHDYGVSSELPGRISTLAPGEPQA